MKDIFGYASSLVCLCLLGCCLCQFGNHWTLGRYFLPKSLVNETDRQYSDGSMIDGVTLAAIKADVEEEVFLGLILLFASIVALMKFRAYRDKARNRRRESEIAKIKQKMTDLIFKTGAFHV